jgi:hypothetical protein
MKKQNKSIGLVTRLFGGAMFLGVFMLNIVLFVQSNNGGLSIETLKAYAQTGGTNNEEENSDYEYKDVFETKKTVACTINGNPGKRTTITSLTTCMGSGATECTAGTDSSDTGCIAN